MITHPWITPASTEGWPLYDAAASQTLDHMLIATGRSGFSLMQQAAHQAWQWAREHTLWSSSKRIAVFCGAGKNGGDGLMLAVYAKQAGWRVEVYLAQSPDLTLDEVAAAWQAVQQTGVLTKSSLPSIEALQEYDLLVDALLGIGIQGQVRAPLAQWIERINAAQQPVLALDLPSGLEATSGQACGSAIRAQFTITFLTLKPGLFTGQGRDYAGEILLADLGLSEALPQIQQTMPLPCARLMGVAAAPPLPLRRASVHKGHAGKVLIIGGQAGMGGAALLAGQAALRIGAGRVKLLVAPEMVSGILAAQPELMVQGITTGQIERLTLALKWCDVLLIGPGLGTDSFSHMLFQQAVNHPVPKVLDADALNLFAATDSKPMLNPQTVLTPHSAEAARLLEQSVSSIEAQRFIALQQLIYATQATCVLKGAGSLVASPELDQIWVCPFGNPGMAVAGMGDLLAGCIAGLMAQGLSAPLAAREGVALHARAGDAAAGQTPIGLLPSDLLKYIRRLVNLTSTYT